MPPARLNNSTGAGRAALFSDVKRQVTRAGHKASFVGVQVSVAEALSDTLEVFSEEIGEYVSLFSASLANNTRRNRDKRMIRINEIAAKDAQIQMVAAFNARRKSPSGQPSVSRSRMANGALENALSSPEFYTARWDGVQWGNKGALNRTAKQWYRLNFGAGERGLATRRPDAFPIEFFGQALGSLTLKGNRPSPPFKMPPGIFLSRVSRLPVESNLFINGSELRGLPNANRRGQDEFLAYGPNSTLIERLAEDSPRWAVKTSQWQITRGITGTNFLDEGVRVLAKNLGDGWTILMGEWFQEAASAKTGPVAKRVSIDNSDVNVVRANAYIQKTVSFMEEELVRFKSALR